MNQILVGFIFFFCSLSGYSQTQIDHEEMVGFGCGFAGVQSPSVKKVSKLLDKKKYNAIIQLLDSDNNAEQFLAVVVCEKLNELNIVNLSEELIEKISLVYNSKFVVPVCSGCMYWDRLTVGKMLESEHHMRILANYWLENKFKSE